VPIRGAPDACDTWHVNIIFVQQNLQTESMMKSG
jgi:hypothetical protein